MYLYIYMYTVYIYIYIYIVIVWIKSIYKYCIDITSLSSLKNMSVHYHHHSSKVQAMQKPLPLRSLRIDWEFCCGYTEDIKWIINRFKIKIKRNMSNQKNAFAGLKQHVWLIFERTTVPKQNKDVCQLKRRLSWQKVWIWKCENGRVFYQQKQQKMAVWQWSVNRQFWSDATTHNGLARSRFYNGAQRPSWLGSNHLVRKVNAQFHVGARTCKDLTSKCNFSKFISQSPFSW